MNQDKRVYLGLAGALVGIGIFLGIAIALSSPNTETASRQPLISDTSQVPSPSPSPLPVKQAPPASNPTPARKAQSQPANQSSTPKPVVPAQSSSRTDGLPACTKTDCNCTTQDFKNKEEAQRVLEAFPADPFDLDRDKDGEACDAGLR